MECSYKPLHIQREEWRDVVGFEGLYKVSSYGRVLSLGTKWRRHRGAVILRPGTMRRGYLFVVLCRDGQRRTLHVQRIVARAFIGQSALQVNHKNGIKPDNAVINLEYVTQAENIQHRIKVLGVTAFPKCPPEQKARGARHGSYLHPERVARGDSNGNAKLTTAQVLQARQMHENGQGGQHKLARVFGVSKATMARVLNRKTWAHI